MDRNIIKRYAVWARRELLEGVARRAARCGIPAGGDGLWLTPAEERQRQALLRRVREKGRERVLEEAAALWFNRFTALRFLEVNGRLPGGGRVFTNAAGEFGPQLPESACPCAQEAGEERFRRLLFDRCAALGAVLPGLFRRGDEASALLLPDGLLQAGSVVERLVRDIPAAELDIRAGDGNEPIQLLGWLYQYYLTERREAVVDPLRGRAVEKEDVPAATQLFTPDWVVRYLVDNTLGRYWLERNPESGLAGALDYLALPGRGRLETVEEAAAPWDATLFDPCVGSGNFLIYAFDILVRIYRERGVPEREAAAEIVRNNLFGLDIDGLAAGLAQFAVMMKACQYDPQFLSRGFRPNVYEILESDAVDMAAVDRFCEEDAALRGDVMVLLDALRGAKALGSILRVPEVDFGRIEARFERPGDGTFDALRSLLRPAGILCGRYAVVATNPPYLSRYDARLRACVSRDYRDYTSDLFSVFMVRGFDFCRPGGYAGYMTPLVWMFIATYRKTREYLLRHKGIATLVQMEYSAYDEATVPICAFALRNGAPLGKAVCLRLSEFRGGMEVQRRRALEAIADPACGWRYEAGQDGFLAVPGSPIAYWLSDGMLACYGFRRVRDAARPCKGIDTGDNRRFLRRWSEVDPAKLFLPDGRAPGEADFSEKRWFPYNKGGGFRKWYGNNEYVVDWSDNGRALQSHPGSNLRNRDVYFREGITWSTVTSGRSSFRWFPAGWLFDNGGSCLFAGDGLAYLQGFLNSVVCGAFLSLQPTLNTQPGAIGALPLADRPADARVEALVRECREISRADWDAFETSWDFRSHPLVPVPKERTGGVLLSERFAGWERACECRFRGLKEREEALNAIFIDLYGLRGELSPEVADGDVTVRRADLRRDIRGLVSYAVGCMLGRYALEAPGLARAGEGVHDCGALPPARDGILPILDDGPGEDVASRFERFLAVAFGRDALDENLRFVAGALGGRGAPREVIRRYFRDGFYADHLRIYQRRPIYWLLDGGRASGFKCLISMHRYGPDTLARVLEDHVLPRLDRVRAEIPEMEARLAASAAGRAGLSRRLSNLRTREEVLRTFAGKLRRLADRRISIDLDDGVEHNYSLFQDVLARLR